MPPKYSIVREACDHCWSKNFMDDFRDFFANNAHVFANAPATPAEEQNLEYYALFQRYLHLYEVKLSKYIESLNCSVEEFYDELAAIKDDESIKDKKLLHFVNYLVACTDYPSFYKVMYRAAKKATAAQADSKAEGKEDDSADNSSGAKAESKGESKMADCK